MAEKKADSVEKVYTIPLRDAYKKGSRMGNTNRTVRAVKDYVSKHAHASEVKVSEKLNSLLWTGGAKNALHTVRIKVKISEGKASAMLPEEISLEEEKKKFLEKEKKKSEAQAGEEKKKAEEKAKDAKVASEADQEAQQKAGEQMKPEEQNPEGKEAEAAPEPKPEDKPEEKPEDKQ
jgi:ribosomal protein L31E